MTFKNGIKEYTQTAVLFGAPMGILYGLMDQDFLIGLVSGVVSGVLFSLLIFIFVKIQEKKFDKKRTEIAAERKVICDGGATFSGNGGWMFFTEYGLEFYPHKINLSQENLMIPMAAIKSVGTNKNRLVVFTESTGFELVVSHNKQWAEIIKQNKKADV